MFIGSLVLSVVKWRNDLYQYVNSILSFCNSDSKMKEYLKKQKLSSEYFYNSLTLCVIDSVFSIGIRLAIYIFAIRYLEIRIKHQAEAELINQKLF